MCHHTGMCVIDVYGSNEFEINSTGPSQNWHGRALGICFSPPVGAVAGAAGRRFIALLVLASVLALESAKASTIASNDGISFPV